jgi:hypothetical protein
VSATQISMEDADASSSADKGNRARPGRRGRVVAVVVGILVLAGVGVVVTDPFGPQPTDTSIESSAPTGQAQVTKGTLSARTQQNGTLGYAGDYQVVNNASGKVTKLPDVGQVIRQGEVLYWIDGKPVLEKICFSWSNCVGRVGLEPTAKGL